MDIHQQDERKDCHRDNSEEYYPGKEASEDDHEHEEWSETEKKRYEYWDELLKYAPEKSEDFAKYFGGVKKASKDHWKSFLYKWCGFPFSRASAKKETCYRIGNLL